MNLIDGNRSTDDSSSHNRPVPSDAETVIDSKYEISAGIPLWPITA